VSCCHLGGIINDHVGSIMSTTIALNDINAVDGDIQNRTFSIKSGVRLFVK
jgi:hypothetical protein